MSYKLKYTGKQIDDILDRAVEGGTIDDALALKAPLESPALTGTPTAPTPDEGDGSTKVATTAYADRAADAAEAAAEAAAKEYTDRAASALYITDTASGSIASFSDGADNIPMKSVKASIEPVQDLHGQPFPYPDGGYKNKWNDSITTFPSSITRNEHAYTFNGIGVAVQELYFPFTVSASDTYTISFYAYASAANTNIIFDGQPDSVSGLGTNKLITLTTRKQRYSFTGTVDTAYIAFRFYRVSTHDGAANTIYLSDIQLEVGPTATDYAPFGNICPINGWTGATVTRTGKNLLPNNLPDTTSLDGVTVTTDQDGITTMSGSVNKNTNPFFYLVGSNVNFPYLLKAGTYTLSQGAVLSTDCMLRIASAAGIVAQCQNVSSVTFTVSEDTYINAYIRIDKTADFTTPVSLYPMLIILQSDSDLTYEPYRGDTYDITFPSEAGTVYGGYFIVNSDGSVDLTATHNLNNFASGSWSINTDGSLPYFQRTVTTVDTEQRASALSNIYINQTPAADNAYDMAFGFTGSNNFFRVRDSRYTTVADFVAHLQNDNVQFYYPLLTPQTYHLDSIGQITSLLGQNNVWSNTGDVEVEYVADPKLYIAKVLGGGALTLGSASPLSLNRPVTISKEDLEQADEVNKAVEAAVETVLPAESGETEEGAQE